MPEDLRWGEGGIKTPTATVLKAHLYFFLFSQVYKDLKKLESFIISAVQNYKYDGTVMDWDYSWTFPNSLLLTMTIMSTIGMSLAVCRINRISEKNELILIKLSPCFLL